MINPTERRCPARARARATVAGARDATSDACAMRACVCARSSVRARADSVGERREVKGASAALQRGTSSRARAHGTRAHRDAHGGRDERCAHAVGAAVVVVDG